MSGDETMPRPTSSLFEAAVAITRAATGHVPELDEPASTPVPMADRGTAAEAYAGDWPKQAAMRRGPGGL